MLIANENGSCGRAETLVTYLYGELPDDAAKKFQAHAARCMQCSAELIELGGLHRSLADWRAATLDQLAVAAIAREAWMPAESPAPLRAGRRSVLTIVADFLTASPRWAQAGLAVAVLVVAVMALAYVMRSAAPTRNSLAGSPSPTVIQPPVTPIPGETVTPRNPANEPERVAKAGPRDSPRPVNSGPIRGKELARTLRTHQPKPVGARGRNTELASLTKDLLLLDAGERESTAPRLSDLLNESEPTAVEPNR